MLNDLQETTEEEEEKEDEEGEDWGNFSCSICGVVLGTKNSLRTHIYMHRKKSLESSSEQSKIPGRSDHCQKFRGQQQPPLLPAEVKVCIHINLNLPPLGEGRTPR